MRRHVLAIALLASVVGLASCSGDGDGNAGAARRDGRVKIVYDDVGIKPENRDAVKLVRDSSAFERFADRTSKAVALPHDIEIRVSDNIPKGSMTRPPSWTAGRFSGRRTSSPRPHPSGGGRRGHQPRQGRSVELRPSATRGRAFFALPPRLRIPMKAASHSD